MSSTTIVPKLYKIDELMIYDVPGFKDNNNNRKIIINILHKCLLNHVKQHKFIVVLKLNVLMEDKIIQLINDYYESFEQLFGDKYRKNIENIYFIITHFDKHNLKISEIIKNIQSKTRSSIKSDRQHLAFFLMRLEEKHIIIDYKNDDKSTLVTKFVELLSDDQPTSLDSNSLKITNLDVYENELNKKLNIDLSNYLNQLTNTVNEFFQTLKKSKDDYSLTSKE
jgi:hypothetical protein